LGFKTFLSLDCKNVACSSTYCAIIPFTCPSQSLLSFTVVRH